MKVRNVNFDGVAKPLRHATLGDTRGVDKLQEVVWMVDVQIELEDFGQRTTAQRMPSETELVRRTELERRRHELRGGIGATIDIPEEEVRGSSL